MYKPSPFVFKPPKKFLLQPKKYEYYNSKRPKSAALAKAQKLFSKKTSVRPLTRFIKPKVYGTGADPSQTFIHFMNKDIIKPYRRATSAVYLEENNFPQNQKLKWAIGTTCKCNDEDLLPKRDNYKVYYFSENKKNREKIETTYLPTDHISINRAIEIDKNKLNSPFFRMKEKFNNNTESGSFWAPRKYKNDNNFNRSSVSYNIINNEENKYSGKKESCIIERMANNKRKGVTEMLDLQSKHELNFRPQYNNFLKENNNGFMKYKGIFTELYDSIRKNGNIYKPFIIENNKK